MYARMTRVFKILAAGYPIFFFVLLLIIASKEGYGVNMWEVSNFFYYGEHEDLYFRNEIPFFSLITAAILFAIRYILVDKTPQDL